MAGVRGSCAYLYSLKDVVRLEARHVRQFGHGNMGSDGLCVPRTLISQSALSYDMIRHGRDKYEPLRDRMALSMRSKVYMLVAVLAYVASANIIAAAWVLTQPAAPKAETVTTEPCPGRLKQHSAEYLDYFRDISESTPANTTNATAFAGFLSPSLSTTPRAPPPPCTELDPIGIGAFIIGVLLFGRFVVAPLVSFVRAKLTLLPGDEEELTGGGACYLQNASDEHTKASGQLAKATAGVVIGFELLVSAVPLSPYFYLLTGLPAVMGAVMQSQRYFRI